MKHANAAAPPTDKILQSGVHVGAREADSLQMGLGLDEDMVAVGGIQPNTGNGAFQNGELRVGKHKTNAVSPVQQGQNMALDDFGKSGQSHRGNVVQLKVG